jgi:hypothetical protein
MDRKIVLPSEYISSTSSNGSSASSGKLPIFRELTNLCDDSFVPSMAFTDFVVGPAGKDRLELVRAFFTRRPFEDIIFVPLLKGHPVRFGS